MVNFFNLTELQVYSNILSSGRKKTLELGRLGFKELGSRPPVLKEFKLPLLRVGLLFFRQGGFISF